MLAMNWMKMIIVMFLHCVNDLASLYRLSTQDLLEKVLSDQYRTNRHVMVPKMELRINSLISVIEQLRHPRFHQCPLQQIGHLQCLCPALHIGHIESRPLHFEHPTDIIPLASGYFPTPPVPF